MRYPKLLQKGDTIGVCAPSSGVRGDFKERHERLDKALENVRAQGYKTLETASVRRGAKCVSADAKTRADEFMSLYENPEVAAIIPPWGGEFLMDMLPNLDFKYLSALPPKWICGYSDISTLTFALTVCCDMATVHGSNLMNMGYATIHEADLAAFTAMSNAKFTQKSSEKWGRYTGYTDLTKPAYDLTEKTEWKPLGSGNQCGEFSGRMLGGCMDTLRGLIGTDYAPVARFLKKYMTDGFIWALESCEMDAGDIYRTLWQMRENGWFEYCNGILYGRADGYSDTQDFTLMDALKQGVGILQVPILYDADIGHIPPQIQIVNGAYGSVRYENGNAAIQQEMRA